jgi:hypothetical protein
MSLRQLVDVGGTRITRKQHIDGLLANGFKPSRFTYHGRGFPGEAFQLAKGRQVFVFTTQAELDYITQEAKQL